MRYLRRKPIYEVRDNVWFIFNDGINNEIKLGTISIVNPLGSLWDVNDEPTYDIEVIDNNKLCLYKHISESNVLPIESDGKF